MYTSDLTLQLRIIYKRLNLLIVALLVAVVGAGCGKADKSPAAKRAQQVKNVLESTEVQAKKVALVNALKAFHLPGTGEEEMIQTLETLFEEAKKTLSNGVGSKKEELNDMIVGLHRCCQDLKSMRSDLTSILLDAQFEICSENNTLQGCVDKMRNKLQYVREPEYLIPLLYAMMGGKSITPAALSQAPEASVKFCFQSVNPALDVYDACTAPVSEVLAGLESIKS